MIATTRSQFSLYGYTIGEKLRQVLSLRFSVKYYRLCDNLKASTCLGNFYL